MSAANNRLEQLRDIFNNFLQFVKDATADLIEEKSLRADITLEIDNFAETVKNVSDTNLYSLAEILYKKLAATETLEGKVKAILEKQDRKISEEQIQKFILDDEFREGCEIYIENFDLVLHSK